MNAFYRFLLKNNDSSDEQAKAGLMMSFALIEIVFCFLCFALYPYLNFNTPRILFLVPVVILAANLFLPLLRVPLNISMHVTITSFWVIFCVGISFSGGVYSLIVPWLGLLPLMAFSLINRKSAIVWFCLAVASLVAITLFQDQLIDAPRKGIYGALVAHLGLTVVIFLFMQLFHRTETGLMLKIKKRNHSLLESHLEIAGQNEQLTQQRNEITAQRDQIEDQNKKLRHQNADIERINAHLAQKVEEILERNKTLGKHWRNLLEISKSRPINFGNFREALNLITKTAAISLNTHRVSVWHYNNKRNSIECLLLYKLNEDSFEHGVELSGRDYPHYFEALLEEDVIPADDAEVDPKTYEFKDAYLQPLHIQSMMDTPFFLDGKLGGVICCEHMEHHHWMPEDILFAQSLSDIISLLFKATQRRQYESKVREHKKEISRLNRHLEDRIHDRTVELENQNKQLIEYAFINSHILRGPLSRILGLINLMEHTEMSSSEQELINHLKLSGEELDDVVKKINQAIENGSHFDRSHLKA